MALWQPELNVEVHRIGQKIVTVFTHGAGGSAVEEGLCARFATVATQNMPRDPPLDSIPHKPQIDYGPASSAVAMDSLRLTMWA